MTRSVHDLHTRESTLPDGRAVITRRINAPPGVVWSVLADGWMYAAWVVGASRVKVVEPDWPAPGSRLHHSFGIWLALINDHTEVLTCDPGRELRLKARGWPAGEATIRIRVTSGGTRDSSIVSIVEDASSGAVIRRNRQCRHGRPRLRRFPVTEQQTITVPVTHEEIRVVSDPAGASENLSDMRDR